MASQDLDKIVLLSPKHAGEQLGVSAARVAQLAREGRIKALRDSSGRRLFLEADVAKLARTREVK